MLINNKIDLNTCVPGQNLERRDGALVTYERKSIFSIDYPHLVDGESYTDDGYYRLSRTEDSWDIVKIFPVKKPRPEIDLNTCVPGQRLELRNGDIVEYEGEHECASPYSYKVNGEQYTNDGCYLIGREDSWDVVKILPMKKSAPKINLNTCVPGQRVKLRDKSIGTYNGLIDENTIYKHAVDGYSYTNNGRFWEEDGRTSTKDVVEILPMEEEPVETSTELTHSITDQVDVTSPDHVSIIPHEHGVTISIKKGLTTISWRHYNS